MCGSQDQETIETIQMPEPALLATARLFVSRSGWEENLLRFRRRSQVLIRVRWKLDPALLYRPLPRAYHAGCRVLTNPRLSIALPWKSSERGTIDARLVSKVPWWSLYGRSMEETGYGVTLVIQFRGRYRVLSEQSS